MVEMIDKLVNLGHAERLKELSAIKEGDYLAKTDRNGLLVVKVGSMSVRKKGDKMELVDFGKYTAFNVSVNPETGEVQSISEKELSSFYLTPSMLTEVARLRKDTKLYKKLREIAAKKK
ncbi:MAG: hypothetical protein V1802_02840 [Candidatus Aenigmatarchaeota archaeon]